MLYDWTLVEVQATQSPADAIQQNVPLLSRQNISFTNFQYPLSAPELDSSKLYAWRITARNNLAPIGNSEVWSFRVRQYAPDTVAGPGTDILPGCTGRKMLPLPSALAYCGLNTTMT
ncbi:hypothetical protein [Paraflavitalea speifideaquila]|uniref:hypothetical protein n=1 Tax=Paraflavitalea speifideaquila TaxID=3076558 RepID=UPI0028EE49E8|nr:hypothetical protein [Paraflavitalea speifideiaquila]